MCLAPRVRKAPLVLPAPTLLCQVRRALPARTGHLEHLEPIQLCQALKAPLALTVLLAHKGPLAPRLYRLTLATTPHWEPMA